MRLFIVSIFAVLLLAPFAVLADAQTGTCDVAGGVTDVKDVGIFLSGVCNECWNEGNCSLTDFMTVVANTGNFILSIIAGLVFLVYILGGFFWIIAHGDKGMVEKGKKWIKNATVGLVIVLFAYTGVVALRAAITGETASTGYVICSGADTDGDSCAANSKCDGFSCVSSCEKSSDGAMCTDAETAATFKNTEYSCTDGTSSCPADSQKCCTPVP
ncbi:MAG: pilin [Patescibacteria group bacterium]|jgi:hypothetical protein